VRLESIARGSTAGDPRHGGGRVLDIAAAPDRTTGAAVPNHADLFADIDSMEPDRFAQHLSPDATMRFGNAPPVHGRDAVRDAWASFCDTLDGVHHDLVEQWHAGDATIVEASVTYTRKDHSVVTVPVATIYRARGELIEDYRIFIDLTPLFAGD
jgi:ketosteroid isomerase-like protein